MRASLERKIKAPTSAPNLQPREYMPCAGSWNLWSENSGRRSTELRISKVAEIDYAESLILHCGKYWARFVIPKQVRGGTGHCEVTDADA